MSDEFLDLRTCYLVGEVVTVRKLPARTSEVLVRTANGAIHAATLGDDLAHVFDLPVGTHALEARSSDGTLLVEEFVSVREHIGDDPIMGFVTSFERETLPTVLTWLRQLRVTVVQIYDWMASYSSPLAHTAEYHDPLGRPITRAALEELIEGVKQLGAVAQAYAPVCASDESYAAAHAQSRLFQNDGVPQSLGTLLQIMDPASEEWQRHWIENYGAAADALGFNGFHLDTYGYPRNALDVNGKTVDIERGYSKFIDAVRVARPSEVISFNQVNGVPRGISAPGLPAFRYAEVWPPNDKWRHLEGLVQRSAGDHPAQGDTLALYPPVWQGDRASALRTAVLSEAVVTVLGANTLLWGDAFGVLRHPYYVNHERLTSDEVTSALEWHRFGLRCRDLFKCGVDTSWYELADENASVTVSWQGSANPEPVEHALFVRIRRDADVVVLSVLDLTGSADGSWMSTTDQGTCSEATVSMLLDEPERWCAHVAILGRDKGRFTSLDSDIGQHREGRTLTCTVPMSGGWSVLRVQPKVSG